MYEVGADCWCHLHGPHTHPGVPGATRGQPQGAETLNTGHPFCFGCWSFLAQTSASRCIISPCRHAQPAFSPGVLLLLCNDLCCCPMSPVLLVSPPEASSDRPKAAVNCHPSPSLPWLLEAGTFPRAPGFGNRMSLQNPVNNSQLLAGLSQPWLLCPSSSVSPALGGTAVISTILASSGTIFGLPVSILSSLKAAPSVVTQGAGLWERAHLSPGRTRNQATVQLLD